MSRGSPGGLFRYDCLLYGNTLDAEDALSFRLALPLRPPRSDGTLGTIEVRAPIGRLRDNGRPSQIISFGGGHAGTPQAAGVQSK